MNRDHLRLVRSYFTWLEVVPVRRQYVAQLFAQVTILLILIYQMGWARYLDWYVWCLVFAVLLNGFFNFLFDPRRPRKFLLSLSSIIIPTSIFLFLTGESLFTYMLGIFVGVGSKFLIRVRGSHVFNPSAIGILFMAAYGEGIWNDPLVHEVNPWWLVYFFCAGIMTSYMAKRLPASLSYLGGLGGFLSLFWLMGFHAAPLHLASMLSVTISLLAFNVLTDPKTSPSSTRKQLVFGLMIGFLDAVFRVAWFYQSSILALVTTYAVFALWENRDVVLVKRLVPLAVVVGCVMSGILWGHYPNPTAATLFTSESFQNKPATKDTDFPLHYDEVSEKYGLTVHPGLEPDELKKIEKIQSVIYNGFSYPTIAVADFDGDGYQDLIISGVPGYTAIYKNDHGKRFVDVTKEVGLGEVHFKSAAFFDFNNDGKKDIFAITPAGYIQIFENRGGYFVNVTAALSTPKINTGRARSISFLDYDKDGYMDVYISNFSKSPTGKKASNLLLKNHAGKEFSDETKSMGLVDDKLSHAAGISDLNGDGYPDIYLANDFDRDQVYINDHGRGFIDATREILGNIHQRNSMTVEFADVETRGKQDIYVTSFSSSVWNRGMNYFWSWNQDHGRLENFANETEIGRCAFAWGAKFFDADLDGNLDLFVASGMKSGKDPAWYLISIFRQVPIFLHLKVLGAFPADPNFGAHLRNCFFWKHDGKYVDIASETGLGDTYDSHTVALIDMDNSGQQSLLVGTFSGLVRFFKPVLKVKNNWIGIELAGARLNRDAFGAKVHLLNFKAPVKEFYPSNGVASQSDPRMVFGLGKFADAVDISVEWPSGATQIVRNLKPNSYHRIVEDRK